MGNIHGPGIITRDGDETIIEGGSFDGIESTERIIQGGFNWIGNGGKHW